VGGSAECNYDEVTTGDYPHPAVWNDTARSFHPVTLTWHFSTPQSIASVYGRMAPVSYVSNFHECWGVWLRDSSGTFLAGSQHASWTDASGGPDDWNYAGAWSNVTDVILVVNDYQFDGGWASLKILDIEAIQALPPPLPSELQATADRPLGAVGVSWNASAYVAGDVMHVTVPGCTGLCIDRSVPATDQGVSTWTTDPVTCPVTILLQANRGGTTGEEANLTVDCGEPDAAPDVTSLTAQRVGLNVNVSWVSNATVEDNVSWEVFGGSTPDGGSWAYFLTNWSWSPDAYCIAPPGIMCDSTTRSVLIPASSFTYPAANGTTYLALGMYARGSILPTASCIVAYQDDGESHSCGTTSDPPTDPPASGGSGTQAGTTGASIAAGTIQSMSWGLPLAIALGLLGCCLVGWALFGTGGGRS
jgi:hypothetical protein